MYALRFSLKYLVAFIASILSVSLFAMNTEKEQVPSKEITLSSHVNKENNQKKESILKRPEEQSVKTSSLLSEQQMEVYQHKIAAIGEKSK